MNGATNVFLKKRNRETFEVTLNDGVVEEQNLLLNESPKESVNPQPYTPSNNPFDIDLANEMGEMFFDLVEKSYLDEDINVRKENQGNSIIDNITQGIKNFFQK